MNFPSVLIITYGRSGSTLLQGIMNSHEQLLVRGENYNFCYYLFQGYLALKKAKNEINQVLPKDPFFGNSELDEDYYISNAAEIVKKILLGNDSKNEKIKAYGFKEIRYTCVLGSLPAYLDFLKMIFPNPIFIFNTRNKDAVMKSRLNLRWIKQKDYEKTIDTLVRVESIFSEYVDNNPANSFHITYEDVIAKSARLQELHSILGLPYSESQIDSVLEQLHSYAPSQHEIKKICLNTPERVLPKMKENPLITVLLCTYNDETYIEECIQSILDQSYKNFEFIILNDGSLDNTKQIIQSFKDPRIRYLEHSKNKGLEDSKNWGLAEARGKYIVYTDGDDISLSKRLNVQTKFMEENPDVGLCASAVQIFGTKDSYYCPAKKDLEIKSRALVGTPLNHPSCMVRKSVLIEHNIKYRKGFNAAEDHPFMVDLMIVSKVYCIPTVLYMYRLHDDNVSIRKKGIQQDSAQRAIDSAFKKLLDIDVTQKEKEAYIIFWRGLSDTTAIGTLEGIRDKIYIYPNLEFWESEFRYYLKRRLDKTISDLYEKLRGYHQLLIDKDLEKAQLNKEKEILRVSLHSANFELKSIDQSISWKLTRPLRSIAKFFFSIKE